MIVNDDYVLFLKPVAALLADFEHSLENDVLYRRKELGLFEQQLERLSELLGNGVEDASTVIEQQGSRLCIVFQGHRELTLADEVERVL